MSTDWFSKIFQRTPDTKTENDDAWLIVKIGDTVKIELSSASARFIRTALPIVWNISQQALPYVIGFLIGGIGGIGANIDFISQPDKTVEPEIKTVADPIVEPELDPMISPAIEDVCPPT